MRTDAELMTDLMERFDAIPSVDVSDIEVHVDNGMVTLIGEVDTHQTRFQVERAAHKVPGLRGLQIQIRPAKLSVPRGGRHA